MHCEVAGWYHGKEEQHSGRADELASQTNDLLVIVEEMATLLQEHPSCFLGRHTPDRPSRRNDGAQISRLRSALWR